MEGLPIFPPGFRAHPLDGALLYFHPLSGTHVRLATAATGALRRTAPRVVMFGITNACNLRCAFCSRDASRPSRWTAETAAQVLRGLSEAGTLEVAYGGGEPLAFAGFDDLVTRVAQTTQLAQHVTTNGTLLTEARLRRLQGALGIVRLSVYSDPRWRRAAEVLSANGQRWGVNLLVDDGALDTLPALLSEFAAFGARDVSILTYVGEPGRRLSTACAERLAAILKGAPLPARLSVCAGDLVPVPRLFSGDCGAGLDFVSITPDQRLLACSFSDAPGASLPATTAAQVLSGWRAHQAWLSRPSPREGCGRALPMAEADPTPPLTVWQSFSGNNSGECVMVARFESVAKAEAYLAKLLPSWEPGAPWAEAWRELVREHGIAAPGDDAEAWDDDIEMPDELGVIGRAVIALGYAVDDAFHALRGLAWNDDGWVAPGGVHTHMPLCALIAIATKSAQDARTVAQAARSNHRRCWVHGAQVLVSIPLGPRDWRRTGTEQRLPKLRSEVEALASGRTFAVEITTPEPTEDAIIQVMKRLGADVPTRGRMVVRFWDRQPARAHRTDTFLRALGDLPVTRVDDSFLLFDPVNRPKRLARLAYRHGGSFRLLSGHQVEVTASIWLGQPAPTRGKKAVKRQLAAGEVERAARAISGYAITKIEPYRADTTRITGRTSDPASVLQRLSSIARQHQANLSIHVSDVDELSWTIRRLLAATRV